VIALFWKKSDVLYGPENDLRHFRQIRPIAVSHTSSNSKPKINRRFK
jgi:hypothetical protein